MEQTRERYLSLLFDIPVKQAFTYRDLAEGEGAVGKRAVVDFGRRQTTGFITGVFDEAPAGIEAAKIKTVRRVIDKEPLFGTEDLELAEWMASYYFCQTGEALAAMLPSGRRETGFASFAADDIDEAAAETALELSAEQEAALAAISGGGGGALPFYLYGITGSGKTEVFLRAAEFMLARGKSVIYLVPEIALSRQTAEAIGKRFGAAAATLHSKLSSSQRLAEWKRIRRGDAPIVVGPRSAVFAPVKNLGLIIIDEEHDGSYKSGSTPRYHGRQVAMRRSAISGAALVMGSATPSAEAWKLMEDGKIRRLRLSARLSGGSIPEIRIVNLGQSTGCLSRELTREIRETANMGRQTILFLNRRGFAYFYHCAACGFELTCKRCSVSLTWHKNKGRAVCHYCGYETAPPRACPSCGSLEAGFSGFGTEMIEEEVRRAFPDLRIRRVDADTAAKKGGGLEESLAMFRAGAIDLLLGTQMVAKGLNFPGVRLVGVVLADTGLHLPDFRAAERTFSLLVQVSGRAGRYFPDGKVLVQTLRPNDPAIVRACALDVEGFFAAELGQREQLGFPPYSRLIRFTLRSRDSGRAAAAAQRLFELCRAVMPPGAGILGPAESPISLIAGNYRMQLLLRGVSMASLHAAAGRALAAYEQGRDANVYVETDVDPVSML
ncbi:MAG: primosomal protein N' [Spirochaetaceae bacterium]|jgi:primosomal protein N' (replication factor Y)|nr:primosomal protein N' [Spirochaetaceae bacterium]